MSQLNRMNSASNRWEADPWDASDSIANGQLTGFRERATKAITWTAVRGAVRLPVNIEKQQISRLEVEFCASHDGEDMLLMQLAWHGYPDPPEWRLATRRIGSAVWSSWGYFTEIPDSWSLPLGSE